MNKVKINSFEKLDVWRDSVDLVKTIYCLTENIPANEKFGLTNQIRRASISISPNISEGNSRKTDKDQEHFTTISFSSIMEVLNQLIIAKELSFISEEDFY